MVDRRCLQRVENLKLEDRGLFKPLCRIVVASSGSKYWKIAYIGFVELPWRIVVASGRSKSSKSEGLVFF